MVDNMNRKYIVICSFFVAFFVLSLLCYGSFEYAKKQEQKELAQQNAAQTSTKQEQRVTSETKLVIEKWEEESEELVKEERDMPPEYAGLTREELETAGTYLYLCTVTGLYKDRGQAVWKLQNFFRQKEDSFQLLWLLLQLDSTYRTTPSKVLFMMEELYEKGCTSPLLYIEAWKMISEDVSLLHRLTPFWMQVFCYAGKHDLLTEELVMRMAYLSGYEKRFYGSLYQALAAGYEKFSSDDVLEAVCKYIMKGEPRRPVYFKWFSLAVSRGLRITRLFEYYVETMDITYRRQLPKPLLMYFTYNDNSLGDARKAYVYASVIAFKEKDPKTYENYKDNLERFAYRKLREGQMDENYAILYQEFLFDPVSAEDGEAIAPKMFTYRLYCDDSKIRQVIVRHSQFAEEEIYPCNKGIAYPRIYTDDAVILFQDDKQRRYVSTIPYNLTKLTDESKAVPELLELGVRERGLLLYYCESTTLNADNLEYFQSLAELEDCTEEYRNSVRKQILDYYAANVQDQKLDKYLEKMAFLSRMYTQQRFGKTIQWISVSMHRLTVRHCLKY